MSTVVTVGDDLENFVLISFKKVKSLFLAKAQRYRDVLCNKPATCSGS